MAISNQFNFYNYKEWKELVLFPISDDVELPHPSQRLAISDNFIGDWQNSLLNPVKIHSNLERISSKIPFSKLNTDKPNIKKLKQLALLAALTDNVDQYVYSNFVMAFFQSQRQLRENVAIGKELVPIQQSCLLFQPSFSKKLKLTSIPITHLQNLTPFKPAHPSTALPAASLDEACDRISSQFNASSRRLIPFSFTDYWNQYCKDLPREEQVRFLTALFYCFYLNDIDIPSMKATGCGNPMEFFCWQILAQNISEKSLAITLDQLSFDQKARLACLAFAHYREGSFFVVEALKQMNDPDLIGLISLCQREQNNCTSIAKEFQGIPVIDRTSLKGFLEEHESRLRETAAGLSSRMKKLIPLIFKLPQTRREGNHLMNKQYGILEISSEHMASINNRFDQETNEIASLFNSFIAHSSEGSTATLPDETHFLTLLRTFGFSHLSLPSGFGVPSQLPFFEALDALIAVYSNPLSSFKITASSFNAQLHYLSNLLAHTEALKSPTGYAQGASTTIFTLPTYGKDLSRLSWLSSMAENLKTYCLNTGSAIQDFPIFVFDQSPTLLFNRNVEYINQLSLRYGVRICVYSNEQILELSQRLNLGQLIDTSKKGKLGYGGARNAVYMLSPILKELDQQGLRTPEQVFSVSLDHLHDIFLKTLSSNRWTIHMGDDDAQIPYAYFLADLLLAQKNHGSSFVKCGEFIGRNTMNVNGMHFEELFNLEKILVRPEILFEQTLWSSNKQRTGMCGSLRSFGWSILPFGCEESYNAEEKLIESDIRPSGFHLAGRRFPTTPLPSSPIIGIADRLNSFLPYLFEIALVTDLIDPTNKHEQTILPWKQPEDPIKNFANLASVFNTLSSSATEKTMRTQMLKNYWAQYTNPSHFSVFRILSLINSYDVDRAIDNYLNTHLKTSASEIQELEQCRSVFKKLQEDFKAFSLFNQFFFKQFPTASDPDLWIDELADKDINWNALLAECMEKVEATLKKPISDFHVTRSLLLTLETVVGGELRKAIPI